MAVPAKVAQRMTAALKRFQPIISSAKARDCNESDTVTIVTDLLSELFGHDKYSAITSEHAIRGTYCDLALKVEGTIRAMLEVKAIGIDFRDSHIKQAVDYAANAGVDWVILTNAAQWRIYRVTFGKPIDFRQVAEIDMLAIEPGDASQLEILYLLTREGLERNALKKYDRHHQATSRHLIAAVVLDDDVLRCIRRELRRVNPDAKFDIDEIRDKLMLEVLRRETIEGDDAEQARRMVTKSSGRALKRSRKQETDAPAEAAEAEPGSEDAAPEPRSG